MKYYSVHNGKYIWNSKEPYAALDTYKNEFVRGPAYPALLDWVANTGDSMHISKVLKSFSDNKDFSDTVINFLCEDLDIVFVSEINDYLPISLINN